MRLIDADALIAHLKKDPLFGLVEQYGISGVIEAQPTIDAVPVRRGKWVPKYIRICGKDWVSGMKCSECGIDAINAGYDFLTDYCPHCGTRMEE